MAGVPPAPDLGVEGTAAVLAVLTGLFVLRVVGQILVVRRSPRWLPPMEQWYSGLISYRQLLATQLVIVAGMVSVIGGLVGRAGWAVGPWHALGLVLVPVGYAYGGSMVARYVVRMARRPDQRWLGGCIPIVFHVVLAAWILVVGGLWRGA